MNNYQAISQEWLDSMTTKPEFVKRLFSMFIKAEPARIEKLGQALENDPEEVRYLAHSLKGSAATLGADRLKDTCLGLENAAKSGDADAIETSFSNLKIEIQHVYEFMSNHLETLS